MNNKVEKPRVTITPEMIKNFKTVTCSCGSMIFEEAIILKKISPLVSPTGKEEIQPIDVLVCKKCGKVPKELNIGNILPDEIITKDTNIIK